MFTFTAENESDTRRFGAALAAVLEPGDVVALMGPLGAGKTRLVQAAAEALGVPAGEVTSPTFVLVNQYHGGRLPIYHFDAYRLRDVDEFAELGPEEYFEGDGVCFVEWADRVEEVLPVGRIDLRIEVSGESLRTFTLYGSADSASSKAMRMREALEA